jgi:hypothetical protein
MMANRHYWEWSFSSARDSRMLVITKQRIALAICLNVLKLADERETKETQCQTMIPVQKLVHPTQNALMNESIDRSRYALKRSLNAKASISLSSPVH